MDDSNNDKLLVSFYLKNNTIEHIDDFIFFTRKQLPLYKKRKLTKSVFYEAAVKIVLDDYHAKGESSQIWKLLNKLLKDWKDVTNKYQKMNLDINPNFLNESNNVFLFDVF